MTTSDGTADRPYGLVFRERVPAAGSAAPEKLLVLLHGVGTDETSLAPLARSATADTRVILARAPLVLGAGQFAWFPVAFTATGPVINAAKAEASRLLLIDFVAQLQSAYRIAPERTVIAGFSQGGIMSAGVGLSAPELVAGFGLMSGRILPELEPRLAPRERLAGLRSFVGHGLHDATLPVAWADKSAALLDRIGVGGERHRYAMGHELGAEMQRDFLRWFAEATGS